MDKKYVWDMFVQSFHYKLPQKCSRQKKFCLTEKLTPMKNFCTLADYFFDFWKNVEKKTRVGGSLSGAALKKNSE